MAQTTRIVFAGTPPFAATILGTLLERHWAVECVLTQPDRPAGRGRKLTASAVKTLAEQAEIPVYQPARLTGSESIERLVALRPDLMVVAAYGLLLPQAILDLPRYGCINVHASVLPRWRGAAPIQRAILAGDKTTGVTIMQMDAGLDTGDILTTAACEIRVDDTTDSLRDRLAKLGAQSLLSTLEKLRDGTLCARRQDSALATYAPRVEKSEALIDWARPASVLALMVRAFNPWPIAQTSYANAPLKVWKAEPLAYTGDAAPGTILDVSKQGIDVATGGGRLRIHRLQVPGGRPIAVSDFLNARRLMPGERLGK